MSEAALALGPPKDTETPDAEPAADLGTVTPKAPRLPNPFEAPSTAGLDKALDMVMGNYDANLEIGKEQDAYIKRLDKTEQDYERHLPQRQELLGRLKVPQAAPAPQMQERSPFEAVGSLGAVVGAFGSLFSRRPMTAAFKAMGAGMDALKQNDIDTFGRNYKTWKDETDLALKQADLENGIIKTVLDDDSKSWDQKLNLIKAYGGALNDKFLVQNAQAGNVRDIIGINEKKISVAERMRESIASMSPENMIMWNYRNTFQQQNGRPPTEKEEIAELTRVKPELAKESRIRDILEKDPDWESGDPERMRKAYQRTQIAASPSVSQFSYGSPTQLLVKDDATGEVSTVMGQQIPGTGQWFSADEKRSPITGVQRIIRSGDTPPTPENIDSIAKMIVNLDMAPYTGYALRDQFNQSVMNRVAEMDPKYSAPDYDFRKKALLAYAPGTKNGDAIKSFDVAVDHLSTLKKLAGALNNGNIPLLNTVANEWALKTGQPAPNNFNAAKLIVSQEIAKAIIGAPGTGVERTDAADQLKNSLSPDQLEGAIGVYLDLMGGQLGGLKHQYETTTRKDNFDSRLRPETRKVMTGHGGGAETAAPKEGEASKSKSGRDIVFRNGKWTYK